MDTGEGASTQGTSGDGESTSTHGGDGDTSSGPAESESGDSSTGAMAVCGDGVVAGSEECDDGNAVDIDECDNSCARAWTIFVTGDSVYNGNINGLVGADNRCRNRAGVAMLPRALKYRALISDSTTNAADRLHHGRGYYRLVNGLPVAHGWDALMYATLENPIVVTETSTTLITQVWTGTLPGGKAVPGAEHCEDWTSDSILKFGHFGSNSQVSSAWLNDPEPKVNPTICGAPSSLYCVEQP